MSMERRYKGRKEHFDLGTGEKTQSQSQKSNNGDSLLFYRMAVKLDGSAAISPTQNLCSH